MSLLTPVYNSLNTLLGRLSATRADRLDSLDNLDATVTSRSPADTALTNATWTDGKAELLDATISSRLAGTDTRLGALAYLDAGVLTRLATTDARLNNLNATISSRSTLTSAQVWADANRLTAADIWAYAGRSVIKSVQHGTIQLTSFGTLTGTASITAVDPAKTFIISSCSGPWTTDNQSRLRLSLTNSTTVTATRILAVSDPTYSYQSAIYSFHVVEFR